KIGIEDLVQMGGGDAGSLIDHGYPRPWPWRQGSMGCLRQGHVVGAHLDRATRRRGFHGITDHMVNRLPYLPAIYLYRPEILRQGHDMLPCSVRQGAMEGFLEDRPQRQQAFHRSAAFGKGEELPGDLRRPLRRLLRFAQMRLEGLVLTGVQLRERQTPQNNRE